MNFKECLMLFIVFAIGYLIFSLIDELADRFIYKVKRVSIPISAEDYKALKERMKSHGNAMTVEKYLKFHVKEDIRDLLEEDV